MSMYHDGMRELQDRYGGRPVADRRGALPDPLEFPPAPRWARGNRLVARMLTGPRPQRRPRSPLPFVGPSIPAAGNRC